MKKIISILVIFLIGFWWWSKTPSKGKIITKEIVEEKKDEMVKIEIPNNWINNKDAKGLEFNGPNSSYRLMINKTDWKGSWDEVVGFRMRQLNKDYLMEEKEDECKFTKKDSKEITWYKKIDDQVVWRALTLNTNDLEIVKQVEELF
ncbi:MAG TPA: hypothetical protein PK639_02935 [Candidatus Woesebacteria bacterium]|nr:hypothetical protein [Candidatus Woesebacteria bacterium]